MDSWVSTAGLVLAILSAVFTSTWSLSWWLSRQFSSIRELIYSKIAQTEKIILDKLEYHEKHDDQRFADIRNEIWEMKLLNAAQSGLHVLNSKSKKVPTEH